MSKKELKKKIIDIRKKIFKELDPPGFYEHQQISDFESTTIRHFKEKNLFYPEAYPNNYAGGIEPYRELKKWYEVIGGRVQGAWIGKQLVNLFLSELNIKLTKYVSSIDIDTSRMMDNPKYHVAVLDGEFPYFEPHDEENTCKINIEFFSTIPKDLYEKINDYSAIDDLVEKISNAFIATPYQIDLRISLRDPEERFAFILEKRKNNVVNALKSLGKLVSEKNKKNYSFDSSKNKKLWENAENEILNEISSVFKNTAEDKNSFKADFSKIQKALDRVNEDLKKIEKQKEALEKEPRKDK
ncbi:MAG: hypothetical protein O3A79_01475 [Candidatus Marinimicrobia bacterium]|nr:hypothetical protein [Candidatus Neomarinimicrobiota bacterium]